MVGSFPMVPGIDFSGSVIGSEDQRFKVNDKVVLTGHGGAVAMCGLARGLDLLTYYSNGVYFAWCEALRYRFGILSK